MRSVKSVIAAGAATIISTAAFAADMPIMPPAYGPPVAEFGGWYLRGDIGFSNQRVDDLHYGRESAYSQLTSFSQSSSFDAAGIFGIGVGYRVNDWFRADLTGQYRGNSNFKATDRFTGTATGVAYNGLDNYGASKSEWLVMANAYVDLGTWWGITPFIGAGAGAAQVTISNFTDTGINNLPFSTASFASAPAGSRWNFAWAAHAGLAYNVSPNLVLELAYSYVDLGDGLTGALAAFDGTTTNNSFRFKNITSHDLTLGVRWNFDTPAPAPAPYPMPLVRKG